MEIAEKMPEKRAITPGPSRKWLSGFKTRIIPQKPMPIPIQTLKGVFAPTSPKATMGTNKG